MEALVVGDIGYTADGDSDVSESLLAVAFADHMAIQPLQ
jgi:hypothetical protein